MIDSWSGSHRTHLDSRSLTDLASPMARTASSRQASSPLLTITNVAVVTVLMLVGGALAWWYWLKSDSSPETSLSIVAETTGAYNAPTDHKPSENIRQILIDRMTPEQSATRMIQGQLSDLQRYIRDQTTGKPTVRPEWIGQSFIGVGIDPEKYLVKQNDLVTNVRRYTRSETAPQFAGNRAFQQFIANTMAPVAICEDFRVNIRLEELHQSGEQFTATLIAESFGSHEPSGQELEPTAVLKKIMQISSVWQTKWARMGDKQLQLLNVKVPASEIVKLNLNPKASSQFFDCTDSILANNGCLRKQLIFGVDQWASKLPGIDTQGNFGLSIGDVNNDGLDDIYLCQSHGVPNLLLIQKRDGTVVDKSQQAGVNLLDDSHSSLLVDLDNDGDQDLVVATKTELVVMSNLGTTDFEDSHFEITARLDRCCDGLSLSAADYDNDGDIDLFLCREPTSRASASIAEPAVNILAGSMLLRNDNLFRFVDVTASVGLVSDKPLPGRSAIWFDRDLDGDQDLYVTAGKSGGSQFINNHGLFERAEEVVASDLPNQQSASTGDFNADGRFDLLVATTANLAANQTSESHVRFGGLDDTAKPFFLKSPLFSNQYATTSLVADLNNDGRDDLLIGNGGLTRVALEDFAVLFPQSPNDPTEASNSNSQQMAYLDAIEVEHYSLHSRQRNRFYASIGNNGFAEASSVSGLDFAEDSRAIAATDWDHDGDTDVLMVNRTGPQLRILLNALNRRNYISFQLEGETSNRDAIGARIELKLKGVPMPLVKSVQAGSGFLSQSSKRITFGVGDARAIESAVVHWPSGKVHQLKRLTVGSLYELAEGDLQPIEKVSDRYRLKIKSSRLSGSFRQPHSDERTLFKPRLPLPPPEVQVAAGKWNLLKCANDKPSIYLFWGQNAKSEQKLEKLNRFVNELEKFDVNVVTVFADSSNLRPDEQWKYLQNLAVNSPDIKNWTSLSTSGLATMEIIFAHWFGKRELPVNPFGLLVDSQQKVVGIYPDDTFEKSQLLEDLKLCNPPAAFAKNKHTENGFWVNSVLSDGSRRLAHRLEQAGFEEASRTLLASTLVEIAEDLKNEAKDFAAMGRYDLAQRYYRASLEKDPNNIAALLGRSNLVIKQALATSVADDQQTFVADTALPVSDSSLTLQKAKDGFRRVLELDPKRWQAVVGIAKIQLLEDRPTKALATLQGHQKNNPDVEVLAMQGRVLFQSGKYDEALRLLGRAYDERPNLPYLAGDLGYLYLLNDEPRVARKHLRKAHQLHPSDLTFMRMLAETEFVTGNFEDAVDLFTQVTQLEPNQSRSKNVLAWLLATCPYAAQRDGVAALALIDTDSENLVDQPAATLEIYAACYAEIGQFDKAIEFQQQAVNKTNDQSASENYSKQQLRGMLTRLELYRTKQPYRTADVLQTPIQNNDSQFIDGKFKALRF